jgi:hypothetical protein
VNQIGKEIIEAGHLDRDPVRMMPASLERIVLVFQRGSALPSPEKQSV